jgi:hypothetical protein
VAPPALLSALDRAGVGLDTLNSVASKLLAAPYLQGGVPLDTLSSNGSPLLDRDMHGGAVKPIIVLAVKRALGVRLPHLEGLRDSVQRQARGLRPPLRAQRCAGVLRLSLRLLHEWRSSGAMLAAAHS